MPTDRDAVFDLYRRFGIKPISGGDGTDDDGGNVDNPGAGDDANGTGGDGDLGDAGKAAIKREREARKAAEKQLKELQDKIAALEGKDKGDVERLSGERDKLKQRADEATAKWKAALIDGAIRDAAATAGAKNPKALVKLLRDDIEIDEDGEISGVEDVIKTAKKEYPELFGVVGKSDAGKGDKSGDDTKITPGLGRLQHAYANSETTGKKR